MIDYSEYQYAKGEQIKFGLVSTTVLFALFMLFYNNLIISIVLSITLTFVVLKRVKGLLARKRRKQLSVQFRDAMEGLVSALVAGYSLENAVEETRNDLLLLYSKEDIIVQEFDTMVNRMRVKVPIEELIYDLGLRSGVEDILTFSEILLTAKRTGGNLVHVMRQTSSNISEKMEIQREIETVISGKKMESSCMTAIPLLMIVYLRIFSPGFLDPLYNNLMGVLIMTGALGVYIVAFLWGQHIMKIDF